MASFFFLCIQYTDVFLGPIEVQSADRLSIVVVQENAEVTLGIAVDYAFRVYRCSNDRFDKADSSTRCNTV